MRGLLVGMLALAGTSYAAAEPQPSPSTAERKQIFAAAGYFTAPDGVHLVNSCGQQANPAAKTADLNGDGKPDEAVVMELSPCYKDGKHFAIAYKNQAGVWLGMIRHDGSVIPAATRTGGWLDMNVTSGEKTMRFVYRQTNGVGAYVPATGPAAASTAQAIAGSWPDAGWPRGIKPAALPASQTAAIMTTAGYKRTGGKWIGCDGQSVGEIYDDGIADLNGDGHADVIVSGSNADGQSCYNFEHGFTIVAATPTGWKKLYDGLDSPAFLKTRGREGWPDIDEAAARGISECATGKVRYNGTTYACLGGR